MLKISKRLEFWIFYSSQIFIKNEDFGKSRPTRSAELPEFSLLTNNNLLPQVSLNTHNRPY